VPTAAEEQSDYGFDEESLKRLESEMREAARMLEFERAARIRDRIKQIKNKLLEVGISK